MQQLDSKQSRSRLLPRQRVGIAGLVLVLTAALAITLSPTPVDRGRRDTVHTLLEWLHGIGVPEWFGYGELEFTANMVMFLPIGFFLGLIVRGRWRWLAFAVPFLLSVTIETAQLLFLPERYADLSDVLANTLGAWSGAGLLLLLHKLSTTSSGFTPS